MPGFRSGGFDVWGISLSADAARKRIFLMGAESNRQLFVFDVATQTWAVGPTAPYDGGWGASIEYVTASDRLYQIDGRNSGGAPQGTAYLYRTPFVPADTARALQIASGIAVYSPPDARLDVETGSGRIDLAGAVRIARKVSGLEANP